MLKTKIIAGLFGLTGLLITAPTLANVEAPFSLRPSYDGTANWLRGNPVIESARALATIAAAIRPWGLWVAVAPTTTVASLSPADVVPARPDTSAYGVFGSVAMPIAALPASKQWRSVSSTDYTTQFGARCYTAACSTGIGGMLAKAARMAETENVFEGLTLVNRSVNNLIQYRSDGADHWATPVETAARGAGDCEDYAIAKMWLLRSMGYSPETLQLVVLKDTRTGYYHAVLAVHANGRNYILDNMSNRVATDLAYANYKPIESFAGDKTFIHGFATKAAPKLTASLSTAE